MNFLTVQAQGQGIASKLNSSLTEGIQKYFPLSRMLPITNISALLRGLDSDNRILFCYKCANQFSSQHALYEHQGRNCGKDYNPEIKISEEDIPVFIIHDYDISQERLASGPVLMKPRLNIQQFHQEHPEIVGDKKIREAYQHFIFTEPLIPDIRTIPTWYSKAQFSH